MLIQCPQCRTLIQAPDNPTHETAIECIQCGASFTLNLTDTAYTAGQADPRPEAPQHSIAGESIPLAALNHTTRTTPSQLRWGILALLLTLTLLIQGAWLKRDNLSQSPLLRPWLLTMCNLADCTLPRFHAPEQITITNRQMLSHPHYRDSLLVSVMLENSAPFPQDWPTLMLRFSDLEGRILAQRHFFPDEYLPDPSLLPRGIPSRTPALARLEIADPGPEAVNFEFSLY